MCKYELPMSRLSKDAFESYRLSGDRQPDRQTDMTKIIYHAASLVDSDL